MAIYLGLDISLNEYEHTLESISYSTWLENIYKVYMDEYIKIYGTHEWYQNIKGYSVIFEKFNIEQYDKETSAFIARIDKILDSKHKYIVECIDFLCLEPWGFYQYEDHISWWYSTFHAEYPKYDLGVIQKGGIDLMGNSVLYALFMIRLMEWLEEFIEKQLNKGVDEVRIVYMYDYGHYNENEMPQVYEVSLQKLEKSRDKYKTLHKNIVQKSRNGIEKFIFRK
ncbi:MAG: hypothetical protein LBU60_05795 [Clostridiales bacterium]|nr:hypothetical protein [Clostridiales bacterium]